MRNWVLRGAMLLAALAGLFAAPAAAFDSRKADASTVRVWIEFTKDGKVLGHSFGSGFVVDDERVVTNNHVVDQEDNIRKMGATATYFITEAGSTARRAWTVVWRSAGMDLAVISVPGLKRPPIAVASGDPYEYPRKGDRLYVVGYPGFSDRFVEAEGAKVQSTVSDAVVSRTVKAKISGDAAERPIIQHTGTASPGNSGGPVFDDCNVVVGVHTYGARAALEIRTDDKGRQYAFGAMPEGVKAAVHIVNLVEAQRTAPELRTLKLRTTDVACESGPAGPGYGLYGAAGLAILLAGGALLVAFRKGARREVVRVVESYSAYVRRKGKPPSPRSLQPREVTSPPDFSASPVPVNVPSTAGGAWELAGKTQQGAAVSVRFTGADLERALQAKDKGLILGRSTTLADLQIEDGSVSRRHAKIYMAEDGLAIEDLNSAYGTTINGRKLEPFQPSPLKSGDKIEIGGVDLVMKNRG